MKKLYLLLPGMALVMNLFSQERGYLEHLSDYIENTGVFEAGQEDGRAYYIPEQNLLLNGDWKFFYSDTPEGIPQDFYKAGFDDSGWDRIRVPSNWEMMGYGDKLFRNVSTNFSTRRPENAPPGGNRSSGDEAGSSEFTVTPPEVPDEYNPTGAYRTTFRLPSRWEGQEVFLRFEKVASASFVWVNGREVGYNEGAQEPAEYDITSYLQEGENTIAVFVVKYSDGYYLEGQDYWRLAGIFDDVWVYATPGVRLFDWQVITDLDGNYNHALLTVDVDVRSYNASASGCYIRATLEKEGKRVTWITSGAFNIGSESRQLLSLKETVKSPEKWTSETPSLYDLTLELLDNRDRVIDRAETRIGFKETEIRGQTFYLNGVPVKINGINSHMQHPVLGHVMDEATIRKDFKILKQFNFNAVRTSHYPPVNKYLELADEYGLFIIDEAGTESHATQYVSEMPEYTEMYRERARRMVLRDRNHPCVLFWSAGNESGEGENITETIREGKSLDPTRYWMYGGNAEKHPAEDIIGPRYPSPLELEINIGLDTTDSRPSFMDEYLAITGNGGGGLDDYWRVIYDHPRTMGGAIWDFVSTGVTEPVRKLEDVSPYHTPVHIMGNAKLVDGPHGKALDLNGHDQWLEVYRSDHVEITGDQLTITMDVYPRKLNSSSGNFITKGNNQFGLEQKGEDRLEFYIYNGKRQVVTCALPANWENRWHQLAAVYDGTTMRLFIDGAETASSEVTGAIENLPFPINVGRNKERHGDETDVYFCDAMIDNVGLFTKALEPSAGYHPEEAVLWLDFEKETTEGSFFSYGIGARTYGAIWPDRVPQPEMWQMKKTVQPLAFSLVDKERGIVEVWNRSNFTNASNWETTWTLTGDETVLQSGTLNLEVDAQSRGHVRIPFTRPAIVPGREYRLNITSRNKVDELWAPAGFEVSWEQFELTGWNVPDSAKEAVSGPVSLSTSAGEYVVSGEGFTYRFDQHSGELKSMVVDLKELLVSPLKLNVWRAPLANETDSWNSYRMRNGRWQDQYGSMVATEYYSSGIDQLKNIPMEVSARDVKGKVIVHVREQVLLYGGNTNISRMDRYTRGLALSGFESIYDYTVSGDGTITIDHTVRPEGNMPVMLPRMGVTLMLDKQLRQVEWYGRGPQENYPDRKSGYRVGIYRSTVRDMYEPYLIPQDNGLRTDNRWVSLTGQGGKGLKFSMDEHFNFNVSKYTTENLTRAYYTYQLKEADGLTLNLDYNTTGVGGTARPVMTAYRAYPHIYSRQIRIEPLR